MPSRHATDLQLGYNAQSHNFHCYYDGKTLGELKTNAWDVLYKIEQPRLPQELGAAPTPPKTDSSWQK
jgi:hypothetical protein